MCIDSCLSGLWLDRLLHLSFLSTFLKLVCYAHVFAWQERERERERERGITIQPYTNKKQPLGFLKKDSQLNIGVNVENAEHVWIT